MNEGAVCEVLRMRLGELFTCTEQGTYQRVRTPYLYPDGDHIDLFCKSEGDVITVTDLAKTTRWLRMQSVAGRRSPKQRQLIEDACLTLIYVLSTGNRSTARSVAEHVLAAWYDLNHLAAGPEALRFVSLFDDAADVWADEDFRLVEGLSSIARWSRPDEFERLLSEAA